MPNPSLDWMERIRPTVPGNPHLDTSKAPEIVRAVDPRIETGNPFAQDGFDFGEATRGWGRRARR